ncbi:uracil phosphoribosyltransferase [Roseovarius salinarum]|uniref:uracil phosphoribosyltransferase n=1 Tax=Roseovarius salinarum TaxID=1981892 RepID=UPI000C341177|nr:uracil phosphoribosyltransferase [Roseovarius salinarum]
MSDTLTIVTHPLVQHKLTLMRQRDTTSAMFRQLLREISQLLAYEVTRDLPMTETAIETPMAPMSAPDLAGRDLALISILRAGNGLLDGMLDLMPWARVGFVGMQRNEETLQPEQYYFKVPDALDARRVIVVDPMLATGNTAVAALDRLKQAGARDLRFLCLLAAPEGADRLAQAHPDVPAITAALDDRLDEHGYILPGLGDAGDRIYGTV